MLVNRDTLAAHSRWIAVFVAGTLGALAWYLIEAWGEQRWPGGSSRPGLVLGIAAGLIIVFEILLWPRKRVRAWRLGRAQTWLRAHIWLGLLSVPFVAMHSGGALGGQLSTVLTIVYAVVIASGLWGLLLQNYLPRLMLDRLPAETIYSEIDSIAAENSRTARELVRAVCGRGIAEPETEEEAPDEGSHLAVGTYRAVGMTRGKLLQSRVLPEAVPDSQALRAAFDEQIEPFLAHGGWGGSSVLSNEAKSAQLFRDLKNRLAPAAHPVVDEIEALCFQRRQFELQRRLHHWLHSWLLIHAPLSIMLLVLLVAHIYFAIKYW
jgi:hypothetical protein